MSSHKFGLVPKNYLILLASLVWMFAGVMVIKAGWAYLLELIKTQPLLLLLSPLVFILFYWFIFARLVKRHTRRIAAAPESHLPLWQFFDLKSYFVMAVMMSGGFWLRSSHILPGWVIGFFYPGLGFALFACGTRFFSVFLRKKVLQPL